MNTPIKHETTEVVWFTLDGELHSEDGPAVIYPISGHRLWYQYGKRHRTDGPAVIYIKGEQRSCQNGYFYYMAGDPDVSSNYSFEYWVDGIEYDPVTFLMKSYEYFKEA